MLHHHRSMSTISNWILFLATVTISTNAFTLSPKQNHFTTTNLFLSTNNNNSIPGQPPKLSNEESQSIQWNLFLQHHARGQWSGTWTTYDYMGDVQDKTQASVILLHDPITNVVSHTHDIVMEMKQSDCETCFDSKNVKSIPVGMYSEGNMAKYRCASVGMVCGPSLTRSGMMSTELILVHDNNEKKEESGSSRLRVVYQHAPVWENGVEPGSCPPHGLKLFRVMVAKEYLDTTSTGRPIDDEKYKESLSFTKSVPPFMWHKKWAGTAWTWGEQSGDRGWSITELEEADAWHGRPTGDTSDTWSLRLNAGGILLQCPRIITSGFAGLCRVAWLPDVKEEDGGNGVDSKLLRIEASVLALEPIIDEGEDVMLGFYPPILGSLRCDTFANIGELENVSLMDKLKNMGELDDVDATVGPGPDPTAPTPAPVSTSKSPQESEVTTAQSNINVTKANDSGSAKKDNGTSMEDIRNALKL